jgi:heme/copper-type cytochrome/quinol oxidase subunit 2
MRPKTVRAVPILVAVVLAVVGLAACGSDNEEATPAGSEATTESGSEGQAREGGQAGVETIVVRGGEPVGGVPELTYNAGDQIRFRVRSDITDEVHVHGYDISKDVEAGGTVAFSFPADIEGIFEVELEDRREEIAELRVEP